MMSTTDFVCARCIDYVPGLGLCPRCGSRRTLRRCELPKAWEIWCIRWLGGVLPANIR